MSIFKKIFSNLHSRIWFIVTCCVVVLTLVVSILMMTVLYELLAVFWGDMQRITGEGGTKMYVAEFETKEDARANGERINELVCEEGFVLLKNENNALPIPTSAAAKKKVSVFGKNSVDIVTGGSGSGAGSGEFAKSIFAGLEAANYEYNNALKEFYEDYEITGSGPKRPDNPKLDEGEGDEKVSALATGETPQSLYIAYDQNNGNKLKNSYSTYSDIALIVISRIGGESFDLPRSMGSAAGARNPNDHYLQLDQNETDLINMVCSEGFGKVVVVINSATPIETGFLVDSSHYAYNSKIDACLWIGAPGDTGIMALGRILNGTVNPSGRTVDTFARDFKKDPTWQNFGYNLGGGKYTGAVGESKLIRSYVDYEEGIYVGYRYYETRGLNNDAWYDDAVIYPFGYGLSYTTFTQEITNKSSLNNNNITKDGTITLQVKVTNTGDVAGKDAVQVYVTAPYTTGGIEKSHIVLAGFAKTQDDVAKGASVTIPVVLNPYDFASYDYADKNGNGFKGYELEAGDYTIKLMNNSHDLIDSFTVKVPSGGIKYDKDLETNVEVKNRFDDADDELGQQLSRSNFVGTMPTPRSAAESTISEDTDNRIKSFATNNPFKTTEFKTQGASGSIKLEDMVEKSYDHGDWERLLDQVSINDMITLVGAGAFKTSAIMNIGKPLTIDADGPGGFVNFMKGDTGSMYGTSHYTCEPIMAATFNAGLIQKLGEAVGNEALVGDARGDGTPYSGWYAPGMNIHRSPFGGRAGEYFSEDSFLSGIMGSYEIKGVMSKGVYTQVKHFAANEQETDRGGICTWMTEQALREIYLKPFEMAVKIGGTRGMMSSFNRIGTVWAGGDYRLLTEVLRDEWGFRGMVICDFNTGGHMNSKQMHYAGGDLNLQTVGQAWSPSKANATDLAILRNCTKNILYTVANSNALNDEILGYSPPAWIIALIIIDCAVVLGLAAWGFFAIRGALKKSKTDN